MKFLEDYNKETKKIVGVSTNADGPTYWVSTGNYVMNKVISGKYRGGVGQGNLALLAGGSGSGKSFIAANCAVAAQAMGHGVLVVDSEHALDNEFMTSIGVNVEDPYYVYRGVTTIGNGINVVSSFLASYRKHKETKPFVIILDSLDAMLTESQQNAYEEGIGKGEMGQQVRQIKAMLGPFMHDIKDLNVTIICTKQVYQNQDAVAAKNPVTAWKITEAIQYPFTQIGLLIRYMLKDDKTKNYEGIRLKFFGFKTRGTKPYQQVTIEVPYDKGMDPYSGLLDVAEALGVVTVTGSWYEYKGNKFQKGNFAKYQEQILEDLVAREDDDHIEIVPEEVNTDAPSKKSKVQAED